MNYLLKHPFLFNFYPLTSMITLFIEFLNVIIHNVPSTIFYSYLNNLIDKTKQTKVTPASTAISNL